MNEYNFNIQTWEEFEEFAKDLLSVEMDLQFQSFVSGPDGGVDLRYSAAGSDRDVIIQCKRYNNVSSLMSNLRRERVKLDQMDPAPKRYMLAVSLDLRESKVNEIVDLFSPYLQSANDIIMPKQLNSMLGRHNDVERRHYKLWLASSNVLETILSSRVANYTSLIKEKIEATLEIYSPTPSFTDAMKVLKEHGFIIIAGEPGVGKTMLADVMSYYLLGDRDFDELIALPQDLGGAIEMMSHNPEKKQLFLFDDFLGSNYLDDKLSRREDSLFRVLIDAIGRLKKTKALIMTTREYILHQAQQSTEVFQDRDFLDAKYIVSLSSYDVVTRAKILYNHLAPSDIPDEHLRYFVTEKIYREIIGHRNYNPRLIQAINKKRLWEDCSPEVFSDKVIELFNNPWSLYEDIYMNKIDEKARSVMLIMTSIGKRVRFDCLHRAIVAFDSSIDETQLRKSIDILEGTFLKTARDAGDAIVVDVLNPTIYDFVVHYHCGHFHTLQRLIASAVYLNQLTYLFVINTESPRYRVTTSLSGFNPIVLDQQSKEVFRDKVLRDWKELRWIGSEAAPDDFDFFESAGRLLEGSVEVGGIGADIAKTIFEKLRHSTVPTRDITSALYVFDMYLDEDDTPEVVMNNFADSIVESLNSYDDMKSVAEDGGWEYGVKKRLSDLIIDRVSSETYHISILDEEVQQRLSDGEDEAGIKDEMDDTISYFGVGDRFVNEVFDRWVEPSDNYDRSSFYSRSDDEFELRRDTESDKTQLVDNVFTSLLER